MAKIKAISFERVHIPDILIQLDDNEILNNRDLPECDQIKGEITIASIEEKQFFHEKKNDGDIAWKYESGVRKHVHKVTGTEEIKGPNGEKITDGNSLCDFPNCYLKDALVTDFFYKIMGVHRDNIESKSDSGEFSKGEGKASV